MGVRAPSAPVQAAAAAITLREVQGGFNQPIFVTHAGDARLFVVQRGGLIRIIKNGNTLATPFLNVASRLTSNSDEQGLLGLAFEPNYAGTGRFYVYYTRTGDGAMTLARYTVSGNSDVANAGSWTEILSIPHPNNTNHNGGWLGFGPNGLLHMATGDGGGGGDPDCAAQNLNDLRGKLLRLHVVGESGYASPPANIFTTTQRAEIYAFGLRNPWRASFDRGTGDLFIGDVGQGSREEVDHIITGTLAGVNFGWSKREGTIAHTNSCTPSGVPAREPILDYGRNEGRSITGGYVYRGSRVQGLIGKYIFADFATGAIWSATRNGNAFSRATLLTPGINISAFGEGVDGEVYVVDYAGRVLLFDPPPPVRARLPLVVR